ncbi:unnamed protein product [Trichobilharzia regenti]|nr:unnamed protein product [Trichobilharzia regenti]
MVSCDINSSYTSISITESLDIISSLLESDTTPSQRCPLDTSEVIKSLKFCLESNYFTFRGNLHRQTNGVAMGSPVSPIVADRFMNRFKDNIFSSMLTPKIWLGYVDDTFAVLKTTSTQFIPEKN